MTHERAYPNHPACSPIAACMRGLTLIELMIAMVISMLILLALTMIFVGNSHSRRELDKSAHLLENGRYAMQIVRNELQMAGFMDALTDPTEPPTPLDVPCTGDLGVLRSSLGLAVIGVNSGGFACLADEVTTTGTLFVQRVTTQPVAPADRLAGRHYLQISLCGEEYQDTPFVLNKVESTSPETLEDTDADAAFTLQNINCDGPATLAPTRGLLRRFLYIDADNIDGDRIPTLKRFDMGGAPEALVEGIEAMRFEFALDTDDDGSPNTFSEIVAAGEWSDVIGVRVWLLARAIQETRGYEESGPEKSFQLGSVTITPVDDEDTADINEANFKRHVFSSYVELINPAGRRQK